jgi:hypothetical protein
LQISISFFYRSFCGSPFFNSETAKQRNSETAKQRNSETAKNFTLRIRIELKYIFLSLILLNLSFLSIESDEISKKDTPKVEIYYEDSTQNLAVEKIKAKFNTIIEGLHSNYYKFKLSQEESPYLRYYNLNTEINSYFEAIEELVEEKEKAIKEKEKAIKEKEKAIKVKEKAIKEKEKANKEKEKAKEERDNLAKEKEEIAKEQKKSIDYEEISKSFILELGTLSLKIKLDLKKYELASIKSTVTKEASSSKTTVVTELDATKKDIQLDCEEEKSLHPTYLKTRYPLTTALFNSRLFNLFGFIEAKRIINSCNFGILPVGTTAIVAQGNSTYINNASIDPWGVVRVDEERKRQNYLFWSTTAYIRFNPIGSAGAKFYTGPTVGIGYGKDNKINSDNPALMAGWSLGFTIDDTKFFALTYGVVFDPNTHVLPDYLAKNYPVTFSGINNGGTLSSFTQNQAIAIPLKTIMGRYEGIGFSFSYKF